MSRSPRLDLNDSHDTRQSAEARVSRGRARSISSECFRCDFDVHSQVIREVRAEHDSTFADMTLLFAGDVRFFAEVALSDAARSKRLAEFPGPGIVPRVEPDLTQQRWN